MSLADYLLWKSLQPSLPQSVKMVPFGHLVIIPKFANTTKSPDSSLLWKILYGMFYHVTLTETQVYVGPKDDPTSAYIQLGYVLAATPTANLNIFRQRTGNDSEANLTPTWQEIILDDSMMVTHVGAATGYCRLIVWEWESSKQFRL